MLARCVQDQSDLEITSWQCPGAGGGLTVVESVLAAVGDRDLELAFDGFARSFGGAAPRRVDSSYAAGNAHHTAMRLEGSGEPGGLVEAQMVAVAVGGGLRLVTCSTKDPKLSCAPVMAHLVNELAGGRHDRGGPAALRDAGAGGAGRGAPPVW